MSEPAAHTITMEKAEDQIHLIVFFTTWMSLRRWDESGLLQREVALYNHLRPQVGSVSFVTYGDGRDLDYQDQIPGIDILYNRWRLPRHLYALLLPALFKSAFDQATLLKTNQTLGGDVAVYIAERFGRRLIARSGVDFALNLRRQHPWRLLEKWSRWYERIVFQQTQKLIVTTRSIGDAYADRHGIDEDSIAVVPNYVDTDAFAPDGSERTPGRVVFVGRLTPEKNLLNLVEAVKGLEVELLLVGEGSLRAEIEQHIAEQNMTNVRLTGRVPHSELPQLLNSAEVFVLASHYEGHPKALIEAMACGLAVIGANSPGISPVIEDGVTGILCGTDADSLREAIRKLAGAPALRERLGEAARQEAVNRYSLEKVAQQELALLKDIVSQPPPPPQKGAAVRYLLRASVNLLARGIITLRSRLVG